MPPKRPPPLVPKKPNPSMVYEVLIYLNSFYFGMFAFCELAMSLLKAINLTYPSEILIRDMVIIVAYCFLETVRVVLGRKSSLADRGLPAIVSVLLIVPCLFGVNYILLLQMYKLRLEYVLCVLQLGLYITEIWYAIYFVFTLCRPINYD